MCLGMTNNIFQERERIASRLSGYKGRFVAWGQFHKPASCVRLTNANLTGSAAGGSPIIIVACVESILYYTLLFYTIL